MKNAIVIDNGSWEVKAGIGGTDHPEVIIRNVVGRSGRGVAVGDSFENSTIVMDPEYPVESGLITDFETMATVWKYIFKDKLQVDPRDHPIIMAEPALLPPRQRQIMQDIMFDTFGCRAFYSAPQAFLSLASEGRVSGLVIDSGQNATRVIPVWEGEVVRHAVRGMDVGGEHLSEMIRGAHPNLNDSLIEQHKRRYTSVVAFGVNAKEMRVFRSKSYSFADPRRQGGYTACHIETGPESVLCPEALFNPDIVGSDSPGIHRLALDAIRACDPDQHETLYGSIFLTGQSTSFPGFTRRMQKELDALAPTGMTPIVEGLQPHSAWIGGSIFSQFPQFQTLDWPSTVWLPNSRYG